MTQLLYRMPSWTSWPSFAATTEHRPEILLSFGLRAQAGIQVGLINWLIQDPAMPPSPPSRIRDPLAPLDPDVKRREMLDLYKAGDRRCRGLGFPLSVHFEAALRPLQAGVRHLRRDARLLDA
jgi:hypothetical protein